MVSTSLKKLTQLSTEDRIVSDMVVFYLSECCPNLEFVELDYSFCVSECKLGKLVGSNQIIYL